MRISRQYLLDYFSIIFHFFWIKFQLYSIFSALEEWRRKKLEEAKRRSREKISQEEEYLS
jgi:hypothetical protein